MKLSSFLTAATLVHYTLAAAVANLGDSFMSGKETLVDRGDHCNCGAKCLTEFEHKFLACIKQDHDLSKCLKHSEGVQFACLDHCRRDCVGVITEAPVAERAEAPLDSPLGPRSCDTVCYSLCVKETQHVYNQCHNGPGFDQKECLAKAEKAEFSCLLDCGHRCGAFQDPPPTKIPPDSASKRDEDQDDIQRPTSQVEVAESAEEPAENLLKPRDCKSACHSPCLRNALDFYSECRRRPGLNQNSCGIKAENLEYFCLLNCRHTCSTLGANTPTKKPPAKGVRRDEEHSVIQDRATCDCWATCRQQYDSTLVACERQYAHYGSACTAPAMGRQFFCLVACHKRCG